MTYVDGIVINSRIPLTRIILKHVYTRQYTVLHMADIKSTCKVLLYLQISKSTRTKISNAPVYNRVIHPSRINLVAVLYPVLTVRHVGSGSPVLRDLVIC